MRWLKSLASVFARPQYGPYNVAPVPRPPDFAFVPEPPKPTPCPNCQGRPQIQIARDSQGWFSLVIPGVGVFPLPPSVVAACDVPVTPSPVRPKIHDPES